MDAKHEKHKRRHVRSTREWIIRVGLAIAAAALGASSVAETIANVIVDIDPERAHQLAPANGVIAAELAEHQFAIAPNPDPKSRTSQLARYALQQDATAVDALVVLGLQAQLRAEPETAREILSSAQSLSRREIKTHLWAIEEAVTRGDINSALRVVEIHRELMTALAR